MGGGGQPRLARCSDPGPIDGKPGDLTEQAISLFQRRYEAGLSSYTYLGRDETYGDKLSVERAIDSVEKEIAE